MKVQTPDDAKANNCEKPTAPRRTSTSTAPYTVDYEIKAAPEVRYEYVNVCKLALLLLAVIATFLACLVFARDLWGPKNIERSEVLHHHAPRVMDPPQDLFPLEDFMDLPDPFDMMKKDMKNEDEPHLVKTTRITFKLIPKEGDEFPGPLAMKKIPIQSFGGPSMDDGFLDEIMKTVMGVMNHEERRPSFGDLPFFGGHHSPRPIHPKLIIVRKFPMAEAPRDPIKDFLSLIKPQEDNNQELIPLLPPAESVQSNTPAPDALISKIMKDFGLVGPIIIRKTPLPTVETGISGLEGWTKYKSVISKLAHQIDLILDSTTSLKQTVIEALNKNKDTSDNGDSSKQDFLTKTLKSLNKLDVSITKTSIIIKTEDGAMDLINKTDKKTLARTIESFLKELNEPLGEVFSTSSDLTKMATEDGVSQPVLNGIVAIASRIVDMGKIVYDDLSKVTALTGESPVLVKPDVDMPDVPKVTAEPKADPEPAQPATDSLADEPEKNDLDNAEESVQQDTDNAQKQ